MNATEVIKVRPDTKAVLDTVKIHPRETYDDVIRRLAERERRDAETQERQQAS